MALPRFNSARILSQSIATLLALNAAADAQFTWDGGGANDLWSTPANWDGDIAPVSPSPLVFDGTVRLTPVNDIAAFTVNGITFNPTAGAFTLSGQAITLAGDVINASPLEQTLNFDGLNRIMSTIVDTFDGTVTFAGPMTADAGATMTKNGAGTLKFTNPGTIEIAEGGGGAFQLTAGTLIFDGGNAAVYNLNGEAWLGTTAAANVSTFVNSGTLAITSWLAFGRGNGDGTVLSTMEINNSGRVTSGNFSAGFNGGSTANTPRGSITLNDTASMEVTGNNDLFIFAESAGSNFTMTLNDSSILRHNAGTGSATRIGVGGRGLLNIASATATVDLNQLRLGTAGTGAGAVWNRGNLTLAAGASTNNFAIGNAANSYGYYLHDSASPLSFQEAGIGGAGGGNGVMEVRSGTVTANAWLTMNRTDGANVTSSTLLVNGGTLVPPNIGGRFYIGQNNTAAAYAHVDVGAGGRIAGGVNSDLNLLRSGFAQHVSSMTIHSGGVVEAARIFASEAAGTVSLNLNGGSIVAQSSNAAFTNANVDGVFLHSGGITFDTNGFNPTIPVALQGPSGGGLTQIPLATAGAGYIGRPVVKITGGGGVGATAIANFNEATGELTGITITSPGSGYAFAPTITLVGGGATTPATLNAATVAANTNVGVFTKTGLGTLTLGGANTYGGGTVINGGRLNITNTTGSGTGTGPVTINIGGILGGTGSAAGTIAVNTGATLTGTGNHPNTTTVASGGKIAPGNGVGTITVGALTLQSGSTLDYEIGDDTTMDRIVVTNSGGLTINGGNFSLFIPGGTGDFAANGVYNLIGYTGAIGGTGVSALDVTNETAGKTYNFGENAGFVTLTIATAGATPNFWNVDDDGNWTLGTNWTLGAAPNAPGAIANFGGGGATITAPRTVTVDAPQTVGSIGFNSTEAYTIAGTNPLTLDGGPVPTAEITVTNGSHTIAVPLNAVSAGTQFTVSGAGNSLTISGPLSGATNVSKFGSGTLVLNGANTYTGSTTIAAGTLQIPAETAFGPSLTANSGSVLRIDNPNTAITKPLNFELAGAAAAGVSGAANAVSNFALDIPTGSNVTIQSPINVASGSFVKRGGGTLTYTEPGVNQLSNVGGLSYVVRNGAVVLNGGPLSEYRVAGGELAIADATPNSASLTLESGTLNVTGFTSVGRGNGTTGLTASLIINDGTLNTQNLFTGFAAGTAGYNAQQLVDVNGTSSVNVSATLRLAESAGSSATMNVSDSTQLNITTAAQIGFGGRAVFNLSDQAFVTVGEFNVGFGSNAAGNLGVGIVNQTGGSIVQTGGGGGEWRIGGFTGANDALAYGSHTITGETSLIDTGGRAYQIGANGRGVLQIENGATVNSGGFVAIGRFAGSNGVMNIPSGTFNQSNTGTLFMVGENGRGVVNVSGTGVVNSLGLGGGAGNGGGTGGVRVGHAATANGILNVFNGGRLQATGIAETTAAASSFVYLSGGTVVAGQSNTTFMQGLDNVVAGPGNAIFDTNNFDIRIGQAIASATGNGLTEIPVTNGGSGYLGQPIVQITGDGTGATAVANLNAAGEVTSITITNPGINYNTAPTIALLGGGATVAAEVGAASIGANNGSGGLVKQGLGTLTLAGNNTYTGPTVVETGTLALTGSISGSPVIDVRAGATLDVVGTAFTLGAAQILQGGGTVNGPLTVAGTLSPGTGTGIGTVSFTDTTTFASGATLALEINSASAFDKIVAPNVVLQSPVNLSLALNYVPTANTMFTIFENTGINNFAQNLFWSGPEGQLTEGESFIVNGLEFSITYLGGTGGNDIVLRAVPEPTSAMLLLGGLGSLMGLQRFRRRRA